MNTPISSVTTATRGFSTSRTRYRCTIIVLAIVLALLSWMLGEPRLRAAEQTPSSQEPAPIVIRADRAWEGETDGVLYLAGNFEMRSTDWRVTADDAEVHGPVENPELLIVRGQPARISIDDEDTTINGRGARIRYRYREEVIELYGDAVLEQEDLSMTSSVIVYDLVAERLQSSGPDGVEVVVRRNGS